MTLFSIFIHKYFGYNSSQNQSGSKIFQLHRRKPINQAGRDMPRNLSLDGSDSGEENDLPAPEWADHEILGTVEEMGENPMQEAEQAPAHADEISPPQPTEDQSSERKNDDSNFDSVSRELSLEWRKLLPQFYQYNQSSENLWMKWKNLSVRRKYYKIPRIYPKSIAKRNYRCIKV